MAQSNPFDQFDTAPQSPGVLTGPPPDPFKTAGDKRDEIRTGIAVQGAGRDARNESRNAQNQNFNQAAKLRDDYNNNPDIKNYHAAIPLLSSGLRTADNGQGDLTLIYAYAKMMDPTTGVREGEMANASSTSPWVESKAQELKNQFDSSGRLPESTRLGLRQEMIKKSKGFRGAYNLQRQRYIADASAYGLDPARVVGPDAADPFRDDMAEYDKERHVGRFADKPGSADSGPDGGTRDVHKTGGIATGTEIQFGMDKPEEAFDRAAYVQEHYGVTPDQEDLVIGFWNQNRENPGLSVDGVKEWYQKNNLPLPPDDALNGMVEDAKKGYQFGPFDTSQGKAEYEAKLNQYNQRQGKGDPTSAENYMMRGVNGALFSLSDELNGALAAAKYGIQSGDPALAYQLGRDLERSRQQQNEQGQGLTGTALEIVPSLLTGNLLGDAKGVQGAMKIGAKGGALYGFGSGQGLGDSINRASTGGVIGGALGAGVNQVGEKVIAPGFNALSQSRLGRGVASAFNRAGTSADEATAAITPAELIAAGKENNVRVMTSDVLPPTTAVGRTARMIGENIPLIGTAGPRAAQQAERTAAVSRFAKEFEAEGGTVDGVAKNLIKTRSKQIKTLSTAKNSVIESIPGTVQANNTLAALDNKIAELTARDTAASRELAAMLKELRPDFEGKTLRQLEAMRTDELSSAFKSDSLAHIRDLGEKTIRSLYTPLKQDMGAFIKANGKPGDFNKWSNANKKLSDMMGDLKSSKFKSTLNNGATTPEEAGKLLFSQTPSDVQRLVKELSPVGQAKARSAVIAKAVSQSIDPNTGNVSPDKFLTAINALKPSTSALFKGEHGERLDGLVKLLSGTKRAAAANTETVTGMQGARLSVAGVAVTNPKIGITAGVLARAYESPVVRNLLVRLGKARAGSPAEEATRNRLLDIITRMASQRLPEAANDTIGAAFGQSPGRAAAQDETNGRREPPAQ